LDSEPEWCDIGNHIHIKCVFSCMGLDGSKYCS